MVALVKIFDFQHARVLNIKWLEWLGQVPDCDLWRFILLLAHRQQEPVQPFPRNAPLICLTSCGQEASSKGENVAHTQFAIDSGPLRCSDEQEHLSWSWLLIKSNSAIRTKLTELICFTQASLKLIFNFCHTRPDLNWQQTNKRLHFKTPKPPNFILTNTFLFVRNYLFLKKGNYRFWNTVLPPLDLCSTFWQHNTSKGAQIGK